MPERARQTDPAPRLISCFGVDFDLDLLPHFIAHYRGLGLRPERMHIVLQSPTQDNPNIARGEAILAEYGVAPEEVWVAAYTSDAMWAKRRAVQERVSRPSEWIVSADADELHEYPEELSGVLATCEGAGITCLQGVFVDRLSFDGRLAPVRPAPSLWEQFPVEADVIVSLGGDGRHHGRGGTVKMMAFKAHILPKRGGHGPMPGQEGVRYYFGDALAGFRAIETPAFRFALPLRVHHFHWTANLAERLRARLATPGVSPAGSEYGAKVLAHFDTHGAIDLASVALAKDQTLPRYVARPGVMRAKALGRKLERKIRKSLKAEKS